ncbi:replication initiation protein [Photobacterium damselae]|uniref:replication initiation protein n=1 Tax=Photobacterium damselae TaxID=38293 RepID=UPI003AACC2FA
MPYPTSELAHLAPIKYAAAVQSAFRARLKADTGYAGLLTKNPLHNHWKTVYWGFAPVSAKSPKFARRPLFRTVASLRLEPDIST